MLTLQGNQWKDAQLVEQWKQERKAAIESSWKKNERLNFLPLLSGIPVVVAPDLSILATFEQAADLTQHEVESLLDRARRIEPRVGRRRTKPQSSLPEAHRVPDLIAHDGAQWILSPMGGRARPERIAKSKRLYEQDLTKKAQRQIACGILGGEAHCKDQGHKFYVAYECGLRYCPDCGPKLANRLFARQHHKLLFVAQRLMQCGADHCRECKEAIENRRLPHWPPPRGKKPRIVCAKLDFTLWHNTAETAPPAPELMRALNQLIKKFFRLIEKRCGIKRNVYGLAYCDELGGNNNNPHAHAIYVGPWLPQKKKELSALWREITGDSFIVSIKYAEDFGRALYHAVKYPAKFAERSSPERLADLEVVFHRVRRFHTLAAFFAPEAPESEVLRTRDCPICHSPLSEPRGLEGIRELRARGLRDLAQVRAELARGHGLTRSIDTNNCDLDFAGFGADQTLYRSRPGP